MMLITAKAWSRTFLSPSSLAPIGSLAFLLLGWITTSSPTTAFLFPSPSPPPARFSQCGIESSYHWTNWYGSIETDLPLVFPSTEGELREIVDAARTGGCKVRVVGTGLSYGGIVAQKVETDVIVVNLGDYDDVPSAWHEQFRDDGEGTLLVRFAAGSTFLDLSTFLRRNGLSLSTFTGGPIFTLGGVFMNPSVHGQTLGEDRLATLVTGVLAMTSNGDVIEVVNEDDVRHWRGSMGLLGIVLAVEIRVRRDRGPRMDDELVRFPLWRPWSREGVMSAIRSNIEGKDSFNLFYNFGSIYTLYEDKLLIYTTVNDGDPVDVDDTLREYAKLKRDAPSDLAKWGIPKVFTPKILERLFFEVIVEVLFRTSIGENRNTVRDGYILAPSTGSVLGDEVQIFLPCATDCIEDEFIFEFLDATRNYFQREGNRLFPLIPLELRFVDASDPPLLTLEHLQPGTRYMTIGFLQPGYPGDTTQLFSDKLAGLQRVWNDLGGGNARFHHGKGWGYGPINNLDGTHPFQDDDVADGFYSAETRLQFLDVMASYDPTGVFAAGEGMRLLGANPSVKFDRRRFNDDQTIAATSDCTDQGNADCFSGCCNREPVLIFFDRETCTAAGTAAGGGSCNVDCQCESDLFCVDETCHEEDEEDRGPTCFPGSGRVQVKKTETGMVNRVTMDQLRIGDRVHVGSDVYEPIYSFGHHDAESTAAYLRIATTTSPQSESSTTNDCCFLPHPPLEVSAHHMVFVKWRKGKEGGHGGDYVPAAALRVGDALVRTPCCDGGGDCVFDDDNDKAETSHDGACDPNIENGVAAMVVVIESISKIHSRGLFAPLTPSGRIVVNGILASTYVAFQHEGKSPMRAIPGMGSFSNHWLAHTALFPHRLACHYLIQRGGGGGGGEQEEREGERNHRTAWWSCPHEERYDDNGLPTFWVSPLLKFTSWGTARSALTRKGLLMIALPILITFSLSEYVLLRFLPQATASSSSFSFYGHQPNLGGATATLMCIFVVALGCYGYSVTSKKKSS